jgi:protein-tyrosine-phosphatase/GNAT superfamily N-acetyltransferase
VIVLKPASANDLDAILGLLQGAGLPTDGVAGSLADFVVAMREETPIGAGGLEIVDRDALLRSVVVHESERGRGLGERLTAHLIAAARARGLDTLWLLTETAAGFFPRFGFRPVPRERAPDGLKATAEFAHCCPASAVAMARRVRPVRVLVLCTANSARSQIGEALLQQLGGDLIHAASAGTAPGSGPHPLAIETLRRRGIDWSGQRSKSIDEVGQRWDLVITVCDDARESCPVLPGHATAHWSYPDPAAVEGGEVAQLTAFAAVADDLERRIHALLALPLAVLSATEVAEALRSES